MKSVGSNDHSKKFAKKTRVLIKIISYKTFPHVFSVYLRLLCALAVEGNEPMKSALSPSAPKPLLLPSALSPSDADVMPTPPFAGAAVC